MPTGIKPANLSNPTGTTTAVQAKEIQDIAHLLITKLKDDVSSSRSRSARASLASALRAATQAFDTACERRRISLGKGLPLPTPGVPMRRSQPKPQPSNVVAWESQAEPTPEPNSAPKQQGIS